MKLAKVSNGLFPSVPSIFDKFLDGELMDWNRSNYSSTNTTLPAVNVRENDQNFLIDVAVPGLSKDDFRIDYDNGRLSISCEKKAEEEKKDGDKVIRHEFCYQSFKRSFSIAEEVVNVDEIGANYAHGILHITLPKREEVKPKPARQIAIT